MTASICGLKPKSIVQTTLTHMKKTALKQFAGLFVSLVLVFYLVRYIDVEHFLEISTEIPVIVFTAALSLYILLNFIRSIRFSVLIGFGKLSLKRLFPITLYYNFMARSLPLYTGELSYVVLLKKYSNQSVSFGFPSLIGAHIFELLFVVFGCLLGLMSIQGAFIENKNMLLGLLTLFFLATVFLIYHFGGLIRVFLNVIQRLFCGIRNETVSRAMGAINGPLMEMASEFETFRKPKKFFPTLIITGLTYTCSIGFHILLIWAMGLEQSLMTLVVVVSIVNFSAIIPFSISGIGIVEGGWSLGLVLFCGLSMGEAVTIGFFMHACQIFCMIISGLLGYALLQHKS